MLMVNNERSKLTKSRAAAVDTSEPSANAIRAAEVSGRLEMSITLIHAFLLLGKSKMSVAGIDRAVIDEYVASERQRAVDELIAFLAVKRTGVRSFPGQSRKAGLRGDFTGSRGEEARSFFIVGQLRQSFGDAGCSWDRDGRSLALSGHRHPLLCCCSIIFHSLRRFDLDPEFGGLCCIAPPARASALHCRETVRTRTIYSIHSDGVVCM